MLTIIVEIAIVGFVTYQIDLATVALELKQGQLPKGFAAGAVYSMLKIAQNAFVVFAYFLLNPLMMMLLIKYILWVPSVQYLWMFAIYSYSFTIFIVTIALTVIPIPWMRWVFLSVSGLVSFFFIVAEMYALIKGQLRQGFFKFILVCLFLVLGHAVFIFALDKYFLS